MENTPCESAPKLCRRSSVGTRDRDNGRGSFASTTQRDVKRPRAGGPVRTETHERPRFCRHDAQWTGRRSWRTVGAYGQ